MTTFSSAPAAHGALAEAAWRLRGESIPRAIAVLPTHGMTWRNLPEHPAEHELGDPGRASELLRRGAPVTNPAGNVSILARACTGCLVTTAPFALSFTYPLLLRRRAHLLCPATMETSIPGVEPAICHGFAADPASAAISTAPRLATTGLMVCLEAPSTG